MTENAGDLQTRKCRPVPLWGWIVAAFLFPGGIFIAMAAARAIRWWAAILLTLCSYGIMGLYIHGLESIESGPRPSLAHGLVFLGYVSFQGAVGAFQYAVGCNAGLWTREGRFWWRVVGIVFLVLLILGTIPVAGQILIPIPDPYAR